MSAADELERRRREYGELDPRFPGAEVRVQRDAEGKPTTSILGETPGAGLHVSQLVGIDPDALR